MKDKVNRRSWRIFPAVIVSVNDFHADAHRLSSHIGRRRARGGRSIRARQRHVHGEIHNGANAEQAQRRAFVIRDYRRHLVGFEWYERDCQSI